MKARLVLFGVLTVVAAGVCVRLGIWQLHRLDERRAKNASVLERGTAAPLAMDALHGHDTAATHWRRVTVRGVADYDAEMVQTSRSQSGVPGVYVLTPVRPLDAGWGDTALLVLRGYLYSPDARTVDLARAREGDTLTIEALVTVFPPPVPGGVRSIRRRSGPMAVIATSNNRIVKIAAVPCLTTMLPTTKPPETSMVRRKNGERSRAYLCSRSCTRTGLRRGLKSPGMRFGS